MPIEILWEEKYPDDQDSCFGNEILKIRFRRPQLIKTQDIVSTFNEVFKPLFLKEEAAFPLVIEHGQVNRSLRRPDEKPFSTTKAKGFPIMYGDRNISNPNGDSTLHIVHNVPLEQNPLQGSCTWFCYTQPITILRLSLFFDPFPRRKNKETQRAQRFTSELFWFFQTQINNGVFAKKLAAKGYDLTPQFDPSWTDFVMEDQCQTCGEVMSTMPWKKDGVKIGRVSRNICHCRQRRQGRSTSAIMRRFKVIGAYPISPDEAEMAWCEAMLQADSAY